MQKGSQDRYFQEGTTKLVPEGVEGRVPFRPPVRDSIPAVEGLKHAMGYCGTRNIEELINNSNSCITNAGLKRKSPA